MVQSSQSGPTRSRTGSEPQPDRHYRWREPGSGYVCPGFKWWFVFWFKK